MPDSDEPRFPALDPAAMTPAQRAMHDAVMAGPRGSLRGPFNAWLRSPELGDRLQRVGEYLRFNSSLPRHLNELAILMTARKWDSPFEWWAHHRLAMDAGLDEAVARDIRDGRRPAAMGPDEALIYDVVTALHRDGSVDDATYSRMVERFGEQGLIELVGVLGYYDLVSMTLNVARVRPPPGEGDHLPERLR